MISTGSCAKVVRFESIDMLKNMAIYLSVLLTLNILGVVMIDVYIAGTEVDYSGFEILFTGAIFIAVTAAECLGNNLKLLVQNGFTRGEIYTSHHIFFIFTALLISVVNGILAAVAQGSDLFSFTIFFNIIYRDSVTTIDSIVLGFALNMAIATIVYMWFTLYQRFNKKVVGAIWLITVVLITAIVIPLIQILPSETIASIMVFLAAVVGFTEDGITPLNPTIALLVVAVIHSVIAWLMLRRVEV